MADQQACIFFSEAHGERLSGQTEGRSSPPQQVEGMQVS